jgi:hypothetical protein
MKRTAAIKGLIALTLLAGMVSAQVVIPIEPIIPIPIDPVYPRAVLDPASPAVGDSVTLTLYMGIASNSCMAPTYESSFSIARATGGSAADYQIDIEYTEIPVPPDKICPMIYAPVEYGPVYEFGQLAAGTYVVMDGKDVVVTFTVGGEPSKGFSVSGVVTENTGMLPVWIVLEGVTVYLKRQVREPLPYYLELEELPTGIYPVEYVIVDSAATDTGGEYAFENVAANLYPYVLSFVLEGYQSKDTLVAVISDTTVNVALTRLASAIRAPDVPAKRGTAAASLARWAGDGRCTLAQSVVRADLLDPSGRVVDSWTSRGGRTWHIGVRDGVYFLSLTTATGDRAIERVAWRR